MTNATSICPLPSSCCINLVIGFLPIFVLQDLVPCVLLSFDQEQILMWRGKDWKSRYHISISLVPNISTNDDGTSSYSGETGAY